MPEKSGYMLVECSYMPEEHKYMTQLLAIAVCLPEIAPSVLTQINLNDH
jgi:hypothetical protein